MLTLDTLAHLREQEGANLEALYKERTTIMQAMNANQVAEQRAIGRVEMLATLIGMLEREAAQPPLTPPTGQSI